MPPAASTSLSVSEQDLVNILMDRFADGVRRPAQPSSSAAFQNTTSPFDLPQPLSEADHIAMRAESYGTLCDQLALPKQAP